jgi:hypothetical protein
MSNAVNLLRVEDRPVAVFAALGTTAIELAGVKTGAAVDQVGYGLLTGERVLVDGAGQGPQDYEGDEREQWLESSFHSAPRGTRDRPQRPAGQCTA